MEKKILVIEDDPIATRLIDYILRQRGYQVLAAPNGLAGLQLAEQEKPDLIVLNIMLPGIDGLEVCHRLRSGPKAAQPVILMLSGRARQEDIDNGLSNGADDYLTKPASPSEIVNRVESLLARKAGDSSRMVVFLGQREGVGATTAAVNTAVALSQTDKNVLLVDLCPYQGSASEQLGIKLVNGIKRPGAATGENYAASSPMLHETGISVLRRPLPAVDGWRAPDSLSPLLEKYKDETDYFVFDLPLQPGAVTRELLSRCSLAVVVSDHSLDALVGARSAVNILRFLGVAPERIGALITDPQGTCPAGELAGLKPYIEANIAANVLASLPYESGISAEAAGGGAPVIIASPECALAANIRELARLIATGEIAAPDASGTGVRGL